MRVIQLCIAILFAALKSVEAAASRLIGRRVPPTFVVLMYHSVKPGERERFSRQMERLLQLAKPVQADFVETKANSAERFVAVTFDDGYRSVLENAIPALLEKRIPATLFVPTKYLGGKPAWIVDPRNRDVGEDMLSKDDVIRIAGMKGLLIGSHSVNHRPLAQISPSEAFIELAESRTTLEQILNRKVRLFALPHGSSNPEVLQLCKEAGYDRVFLAIPLPSHHGTERHVAGRIAVSPADWFVEYGLKVRGAYEWLPWAIAAKSRIRGLFRQSPRVATVSKGMQW